MASETLNIHSTKFELDLGRFSKRYSSGRQEGSGQHMTDSIILFARCDMKTFNFQEENQSIQIRKSTRGKVFIGFVSSPLIIGVVILEQNTFGLIMNFNRCFNFFFFMALDDKLATLVTEMPVRVLR
jgi:hypothetical protein